MRSFWSIYWNISISTRHLTVRLSANNISVGRENLNFFAVNDWISCFRNFRAKRHERSSRLLIALKGTTKLSCKTSMNGLKYRISGFAQISRVQFKFKAESKKTNERFSFEAQSNSQTLTHLQRISSLWSSERREPARHKKHFVHISRWNASKAKQKTLRQRKRNKKSNSKKRMRT